MHIAIIIADIGYGDTGKGTITDFLSRQSERVLIVRYNGGPQAAHTVIEPDRGHTFSQFGSGTLVPNVKTHLSNHVMINPINLFNEEKALREIGVHDALARLTIDERAMVITPFHKSANRIREMARGIGRHGSCGEGVSETVVDSLKGIKLVVDDLFSLGKLKSTLGTMQKTKRKELDELIKNLPTNEDTEYEVGVLEREDVVDIIVGHYAKFINQVKVVGENYLRKALDEATLAIFEGAQGVLLDPDIGFFPYVTHSDITPKLAFDLLGDQGEKAIVLGTTRIYATRHGPGPFVSESPNVQIQPAEHNELNKWQGPFRIGYLDTVAARYAIRHMGKVDYLAVTCVDRLKDIADPVSMCDAYQLPSGMPLTEIEKQPTRKEQEKVTKLLAECKPILLPVFGDEVDYINKMEQRLGVPIAITSKGMMARHKFIRKAMM